MDPFLYYNTIKYPYTTNCFDLKKQIELMYQEIDSLYISMTKDGTNKALIVSELLKRKEAQFNAINCPSEIDAKNLKNLSTIFNKYSDIAKIRIENQTNEVIYVYIGIAAVTILAATIIIIKNR